MPIVSACSRRYVPSGLRVCWSTLCTEQPSSHWDCTNRPRPSQTPGTLCSRHLPSKPRNSRRGLLLHRSTLMRLVNCSSLGSLAQAKQRSCWNWLALCWIAPARTVTIPCRLFSTSPRGRASGNRSANGSLRNLIRSIRSHASLPQRGWRASKSCRSSTD